MTGPDTTDCASERPVSQHSEQRRTTAIEHCRKKAECKSAMTTTIVDEQTAPPQKKSRSDSKRTSQILAAICDLVKQGLSVRRAAEHLKVHHSTVGAWRSQDPQFGADLAAAEAQFIQSQLEIIKAAAKKGSWQAAAWMLERRLPAEFSQPQVQLNMPVEVEHKELSVVLAELEKSPEAHRLMPWIFESLPSANTATSPSPVMDVEAESSSAG
jgi:transposase